MSKHIILVTGASSGFGLMTARALAESGHIVYASMRETSGRNAPRVAEVVTWSQERGLDLRAVELDVQSDESAANGVAHILKDAGGLDVIVHNAGHMVSGPAEAFTPDQFIQQYDVNVLGAQRVQSRRASALARSGRGLLVWVGSSSTRGGTPPFLSPYFAAKAAMDALAVSYSTELARWGIETTIMVPGAFTKGTNHFANAGKPSDRARVAEYEAGPMPAWPIRRSKVWPVSSPPMPTRPRWLARSSVWSTRRSASARSVSMSIPPRTVRRSSTLSPTACGARCTGTSA